MDETRAIARLPHLEIEIWHRRLPGEQAEQLAISLKATPSFDGFSSFLEQPGPSPMLQPWLLWGQLARAVWQPWLAASHAALALAAAGRPPPDSGSRLTKPAKS